MSLEGSTPDDQWSLGREGRRQADEFRWIESEKNCCDLGDQAIRDWIRIHWDGFARHRWIEHMLGVRKWAELDVKEFGLLREPPVSSDIRDKVVQKLILGGENLTITLWAVNELPHDEQEQVQRLLLLVNVNGHRFRCMFEH